MFERKPTPETVLYCTFVLDDKSFAVPVLLVREVQAVTSITPIPGAPPAICGYVNLRGQLHVALDPRPWLTGQPRSNSASGYLIVFKAQVGEACAMLCDRLGDIVPVDRHRVDVPQVDAVQRDEGRGYHERLIAGYAKLDNSLLELIDPVELFRLGWMST